MANFRQYGWLQLTVRELDTLVDAVGRKRSLRKPELRAVLNKVINVRNIARMEQLSAVTRVGASAAGGCSSTRRYRCRHRIPWSGVPWTRVGGMEGMKQIALDALAK